MKDIEKVDVDISKLFNWGQKYTFEFGGKKFNIFVRLVGDAENNRARIFALRKSAEMRKKLNDLESDERVAYVVPKEEIDKEQLINTLLLSYTREYTMDATRDTKMNLPIEPDTEATLEDREKYQKEIDEYPEKYRKAIKEYVDERVEKTKESFEKESMDTLYKKYVTSVIEQLCELEMITKYREMCTYFGTYKDRVYTKRMFTNFAQFENLPREVKTKFMEFYTDLEVDTETLKKLPEAVQ